MADNIELPDGTGSGVFVKTDDDGTAHWQYVKVAFGANDTQTIVTSSEGLPVAQEGTWTVDLGTTDNAVLDAIAASVAGTLTVGSHAVTNAGTFAVQAAQSGTWTVDLGTVDNAVLDAIAASLAGTLTVASHAVTNAGTFAVQVDGDALTALQLIDNIVKLEDAQHSTGDAGVMPLAVRNDTLAALATTDGDYAPLQVDANGALYSSVTNTGTFAVQATPVAAATGGCTIFRSLDLDESEEEVKGSAGTVYGFTVFNMTAATLFLKFYNATAASVTVGTTTPVLTYPIPTLGDTNGTGVQVSIPNGAEFGTAITAAVTTALADNDTGAPGANACVINVYFK